MYLDEFKQGQAFDIDPVNITKELITSFAQIYDPNKLHLDEEFGKTTRYGQIIAPGVMCFMLTWAQFIRQNVFGDEMIAGKSTKIEWHRPVFAGDVLTSTATVTDVLPRNKYNGIITVRFDAYNQNGEHVLTDVTETVLKRKE